MTGIQYMTFLVVMETYNHHFYIAFWITSIAGLTRIHVLGIYVIELSIFHNNAKMQQEYLLSNTLLNIQMCTHKSRYMVCYHVSKVCIFFTRSRGYNGVHMYYVVPRTYLFPNLVHRGIIWYKHDPLVSLRRSTSHFKQGIIALN